MHQGTNSTNNIDFFCNNFIQPVHNFHEWLFLFSRGFSSASFELSSLMMSSSSSSSSSSSFSDLTLFRPSRLTLEKSDLLQPAESAAVDDLLRRNDINTCTYVQSNTTTKSGQVVVVQRQLNAVKTEIVIPKWCWQQEGGPNIKDSALIAFILQSKKLKIIIIYLFRLS